MASTILPTKALSCDAAGREAGSFVAAPDDHVGGFFDFLDFVAVDDLLVSGEVDDARTFFAQLLADGEQHGVAEAAADQQDGFARAAFRWACRWGPSG